MPTIKLISNPYKKQIKFQKLQETESSPYWEDISYQVSKNSRLITEKILKSFFPFNISKILDAIIDEYDDGTCLHLVFEGNQDEYIDLCQLCQEEPYLSKIKLEKSSICLENARDILPQIQAIFKEIIPIIPVEVKEGEDVTKFIEVTRQTIPLVIFGNYSAGKSTFINALIGREILPSSDHPTTAKIFKITPSKEDVIIKISLEGESYQFKVEEANVDLIAGDTTSDFFQQLEKACQTCHSLEETVNACLTYINQYDDKREPALIHDLIEIFVPFNKGVLSQSQHEFVIFDTPGSNTASNDQHIEVLKNAMRNMTNGLPVFVAELTSLDSTDNEKLYEELKSFKEIDNRFSLIIVNKADIADLKTGGFQEEDEKAILRQSVPKNIYSEGIFFISSIMGLGYKNNGNFISNYYNRMFSNNLEDFIDKDKENYQSLYQYNILPKQLKQNHMEKVSKEEELLYVNSGLFSVETEMELFASKYAAYNKSQQASNYLDSILKDTQQIISDKYEENQDETRRLNEKLENDKKALVAELTERNRYLSDNFHIIYDNTMKSKVVAEAVAPSKEIFDQSAASLYQQFGNDFDLQNYEKELSQSNDTVKDNLISGLKGIKNLKQLTNSFSQLQTDVKKRQTSLQELKKIETEVKKAVSEKLLSDTKQDYESQIQSAKQEIVTLSMEFWGDKGRSLKEELSLLIGNSHVLNTETKEDIQTMISQYKEMALGRNIDDIFKKENLIKGFVWGDFRLFVDSSKIDTNKLSKKYQKEIQQELSEIAKFISQSHEEEYLKWNQNLMKLIMNNIVSFSPDLQSTSDLIVQKNIEIDILNAKLDKLQVYKQDIEDMLTWKEEVI